MSHLPFTSSARSFWNLLLSSVASVLLFFPFCTPEVPCQTNEECPSGFCQGGLCKPLKPCQSLADCNALQSCRDGFCKSAIACFPACSPSERCQVENATPRCVPQASHACQPECPPTDFCQVSGSSARCLPKSSSEPTPEAHAEPPPEPSELRPETQKEQPPERPLDGSAELSSESVPEPPPEPLACLGGQTRCSGLCTSLSSDSKHCGSCNRPCSSGQTCLSGSCKALSNCGNGTCDTTQRESCSSCPQDCKCPAGQTCISDTCTSVTFAQTGRACDSQATPPIVCNSTDTCVNFGTGFPGICLKSCTASSQCGTNFECVSLGNGQGACLQRNCTASSQCQYPNHDCVPPDPLNVRYCYPKQLTGPIGYASVCNVSTPQQRCQTGLFCLSVQAGQNGICTAPCSSSCSSFSPTGAQCVEIYNGAPDLKACLFFCSTSSNCPSGRGLTCNTQIGGICSPP